MSASRRSQAEKYYPQVPIITTGDMRSTEAGDFWSEGAIFERLDNEGLPIFIAGWPCDGDSAQNKKANGLEHASTGLITELSRVVNVVYEYMNSPRMESESRMHREAISDHLGPVPLPRAFVRPR